MFNLTITNFQTLETKKVNVFKWSYIEPTIRKFIPNFDELILQNSNIFVKCNEKIIAGCVIKQNEKPKVNIMYGDIFYAELEENGTSVQSGYRPVLIVSNNMCNASSDVISVVPLTSQEKTQNLPTHVIIHPNPHTGLTAKSTIMCEQIIPLSKSNLKERIGNLNIEEMENVGKSLKIQLNLK